MDREAEYHSEITKLHHYHYRRNSRAITAVWAIFTICFAVLNAIAFIQPQWIGDTESSPGVGFFGVYEYCQRLQVGGEYSCRGDFLDFKTILNDSFRASSMLVGICNLLFIFSAVCLLLFCFIKAGTTLRVCGWLQFLAGLCMTAGCIVYPNGWDDPQVKMVCGSDAGKFQIGRCEVRWAFILSIVLIFDAFILAFLAFMLAAKQANLLQKPDYEKEKSARVNGGFSPEFSATDEKRPYEPEFFASTEPSYNNVPEPPKDIFSAPTFSSFSAPNQQPMEEEHTFTANFDDDANSSSEFDMNLENVATEDADIRL